MRRERDALEEAERWADDWPRLMSPAEPQIGAAVTDYLRRSDWAKVSLRHWISILRGGPGSGHWGHEGRPGQVGGSLPGQDGPKERRPRTGRGFFGHKGRPGKRREEGLPPGRPRREGGQQAREQQDQAKNREAAREIAERLHDSAGRAEPTVTRTLTEIAGQVGGFLAGLQFRLKTVESLAGKIERESRQTGLSVAEAAAEITDALRYTVAFDDPREYTDGVLRGIELLEAAGFTLYDHRLRNYWGAGDEYDGYNTVWTEARTGQRVEIQWHTSESLARKEKAHVLYQQIRQKPTESPQAADLMRQMHTIWRDYQKPHGWERLPGIRMEAQLAGK